MLDRYQVAEARAWGADCILIIMAAVDDVMAGTLCAYAKAWGMDAIAEVHDKSELDRALALDCRLIGINNRDLKTFETTLETTETARAARAATTASSSPRAASPRHADLQRLAKAGVHAFLVGESLMRQADVAAATRALLGSGLRDDAVRPNARREPPCAPLPIVAKTGLRRDAGSRSPGEGRFDGISPHPSPLPVKGRRNSTRRERSASDAP